MAAKLFYCINLYWHSNKIHWKKIKDRLSNFISIFHSFLPFLILALFLHCDLLFIIFRLFPSFLSHFYTVIIFQLSLIFSFNILSLFWCGKERLGAAKGVQEFHTKAWPYNTTAPLQMFPFSMQDLFSMPMFYCQLHHFGPILNTHPQTQTWITKPEATFR